MGFLNCLGLPKYLLLFFRWVYICVVCICLFMIDCNGLRGFVDEELFLEFVRLYRLGVPVSVIRVRLGVGSSVYYKLFQKGVREGLIVPRYRRRG